MVMVKEVKICRFKGINACKISDLKRVNLLIGKNNSGKSSIIEAIYFFCREWIERGLARSLRRRTDRGVSARELWFDYDTGQPITVDLGFDNGTQLQMQITRNRERVGISMHSTSKATPFAQELSTYGLANFGAISPHREIKPPEPDSNKLWNYFLHAQLIDALMKTRLTSIEADYLNELVLSNKEIDLAKRYSEIFGEETNFQFIPHRDFPNERSRFSIWEPRKRIYLDDFGDGSKYALAILSAAATEYDTVLFIEEIENHQHPGSLKKLTKHLIEIARLNNLQLFVTTHSFEAFRQFYYYYKKPEDREKEFQCFHVSRDAKSGIVEAKPEDNFQTIMEDIFEIEQ